MRSVPIEIWVGLVGVNAEPGSDSLEGQRGGYLNAVALVENRSSFCLAVESALAQWKMLPFEYEDIEPLRERLAQFEVPLRILSMAEQTEKDGIVRFGSLFTYP